MSAPPVVPARSARPGLGIWLLLVLAGAILCSCAHPVAAQEDTPGAAREEPECAVPVAFTGEVPPEPAPQLRRAHDIATGAGVRVAVIDTGVTPHPRLGEVRDGGDLVVPEDGTALHDCDGHGTVVAGVLAARPGEDGAGPVGVAPEAELLSIRQSSGRFRDVDDSPVGTVGSLATAIDRAVDQDAAVISISVVACVPADTAAGLDTGTLDAALRRAEEHDVVVVAAAGNVGAACEPGAVVYPAHAPTVLAVAGFRDPHQIADYSVPSPDPGALSAPGYHPVGLSPTGHGLATGLRGDRGTVPFEGTSFAAPVVAGTVALVRERRPGMSAAAVRELIVDSADPATGAVDPYRAVTHLPADASPPPREAAVARQHPDEPVAATRAGWLLTGLLTALVLAAGWAGTQPGRTLFRARPGDPAS